MPSRPLTSRRGIRPAVRVWPAVAAALVLAWWPASGTAGAAGGVSLSQDPVPVAMGGLTPVTVRWTGQAPRKIVFIRICATSIASPDFDEALDCSLLSEVTPNGTADGSGSATVQVFRGPEPGGDNAWGCFAAGDVPPPGIRAVTTCYVRVTDDVVSNKDAAAEAAFTIVPGPGTAAPTAAAGATPGAAVAGATAVPLPASIGLTG